MNLKETISNGYSNANAFLSWSGFCKSIQETNVLSPEELKRLVHLFVSGLSFVLRKVNFGSWSLQICSKRTHVFSLCGVVGGGGGGGGGLSKTLPRPVS